MFTTSSAMAGAEDNPGDFIPATSINPLISLFSSIMKSSVSGIALKPAKVLIPFLKLIFSVVLNASFLTSFKPSPVVLNDSLSYKSTALGPTKRFPCTVGVTSIPLPNFDGH